MNPLQLRKLGLTLLTSILLAISANVSAAPVSEAEIKTRQTIDLLKSTVIENKGTLPPAALESKLKGILEPLFDFDQMAKSSLGANWNKANPEEQKKFVTLFSRLISSTYLVKVRNNVEESVVTFLPTVVKGDRIIVRTKATKVGEVLSVDYRMLYSDTDGWKVYDVIIENVSLVSNYRNEFSSILQNESVASLIKSLEERVAKLGN